MRATARPASAVLAPAGLATAGLAPAGLATAGLATAGLAPAGLATAEGDVVDGQSDDDPFIRTGIPTGGVFSGDDTEKTQAQAQAWGGEADQEFDPCYHESCDRLDDVDRVALGRFTDAVDASLRRFAASTAALEQAREG